MTKASSIIFLSLPESLKEKAQHFNIDFTIPIPVEFSPEEANNSPGENLSWEMILSGMLRIISAYGQKNIFDGMLESGLTEIKHGSIIDETGIAEIPPAWVDYYRSFVLSVKPEIYHEFTSAAIVKAGNGEYDMALEINAVLEGLFPRSPGVLLNKALVLEGKARALEKNGHNAEKDFLLAKKAYEKAMSQEPVLPDAFFNAGFFYMGLRNFEKARECFSLYISLGLKLESSQDHSLGLSPEKIEQAKKILRDISGQGLDDISFREAYDLINRGQDHEGLVKIREFIERNPRIRNGWFVLGWALRKLGRYNDALEAFNKAVELGDYDIDTRNEIAICHMELGDLKAAQSELEKALREDPENIKIISNLGVLALKKGKNSEAKAFFRTVLELDPSDPLASHYLEQKNK